MFPLRYLFGWFLYFVTLTFLAFLALIRGYERPLQPVPGDCGYHLHAHWLVLCHPTTNKVIKYIYHDLILGSVIYLTCAVG
jgi:hypothetical protein